MPLPRVKAFPIVSENSIITDGGAALRISAKEKRSELIGHFAPEIRLKDHLGRMVSLHATIALGRPIVLYFFPLAGSPHCTKESCSFRDAMGTSPVFNDLNVMVIGISQDPPERSKRFVDEHHLGFRILHDESRRVMDEWGVGRALMGLIDSRCTFIIDHRGIVRGMAEGVFDYKGHRNFAEKWLIRIEHELAGREKHIIEAGMTGLEASAENDRNIRILYGSEGSALGGGIGCVPRYGAAAVSKDTKMDPSKSGQARPLKSKASRRGFFSGKISGTDVDRPPRPMFGSDHGSNRSRSSLVSTRSQPTQSTSKYRHAASDYGSRYGMEDDIPPIPPTFLQLDRNEAEFDEKPGSERSPRSRAGSAWGNSSSASANSISTAETSAHGSKSYHVKEGSAGSFLTALEQPDAELLAFLNSPPSKAMARMKAEGRMAPGESVRVKDYSDPSLAIPTGSVSWQYADEIPDDPTEEDEEYVVQNASGNIKLLPNARAISPPIGLASSRALGDRSRPHATDSVLQRAKASFEETHLERFTVFPGARDRRASTSSSSASAGLMASPALRETKLSGLPDSHSVVKPSDFSSKASVRSSSRGVNGTRSNTPPSKNGAATIFDDERISLDNDLGVVPSQLMTARRVNVSTDALPSSLARKVSVISIRNGSTKSSPGGKNGLATSSPPNLLERDRKSQARTRGETEGTCLGGPTHHDDSNQEREDESAKTSPSVAASLLRSPQQRSIPQKAPPPKYAPPPPPVPTSKTSNLHLSESPIAEKGVFEGGAGLGIVQSIGSSRGETLSASDSESHHDGLADAQIAAEWNSLQKRDSMNGENDVFENWRNIHSRMSNCSDGTGRLSIAGSAGTFGDGAGEEGEGLSLSTNYHSSS
ncbi:AhpC-TSA-domain-containing protein [Violaceomyces palustris]|uniref:AhpC-TSA-domain-containing protein n=1 Tax=Violaceomyces palustris TaxID=1673888 RepID=A0ACD0NMU4_9BASI|nr:AhpC-TSA-domain-containing protein [Violaceomyces palustris]